MNLESDNTYRLDPAGGAMVRADIVDVYVFRRSEKGHARALEFLQLLRARDPLRGTWQPIMGHMERGERAVETALREMNEEVGLAPGAAAFVGMWALEQVYPYFVAAIDCVVLSPRFAAEVTRDWIPQLNGEHEAFRWIDDPAHKLWPGQRMALKEIDEMMRGSAETRERLRIV